MSLIQRNSHQHEHDIHVVHKDNRLISNCQDVSTIVEIGKDISFNPAILDTYRYDGWQPVHYDLLMVCAAIEFADRRYAHPSTHWSRPFHITIPVLELGVWQQPDVQSCLSDTLRHLTGDHWRFSFISTENASSNQHRQRPLPFGNSKQFAMAYSDGLDSRCVSGIYDKGDIAVRVRISKSKDKIKYGDHPFDLIPFEVKLRSQESSVRSRGFKFAAITAIAGQLSGVSRIIVPESGQGALGPVLLPLHNVYADYRNYPTFFRKMERFIKTLFAYDVSYEQPRLWYTKGQTISTLLAQPDKSSEFILNTRSCWQRRWNVRVDGELRQCGLCAACLLRRMSMHSAGISEHHSTYTFEDLTLDSYMAAIPINSQVRPKEMIEYGSVGIRHLQQLADLAVQSDSTLRRHVVEIALASGASEQKTLNNMRKLLMQHAEEWRNFINHQGTKSFLHNWLIGGRHV